MENIKDNATAVILAGGQSSRMGTCKAKLPWNGKTLLDHMIEKVRRLGIEDIVVSGYSPAPEGTRSIPDVYEFKGPLGGIHAGQLAAKHPHCLVIGVDTPLVPVRVLSKLMETHLNGQSPITVLSHGDHIEPIIGVYDSNLAPVAERILMSDKTSIRGLLEKAGYAKCLFEGDETLLKNCNTPEELASAQRRGEEDSYGWNPEI